LEEIDINQLMRPRKICVCRQVSESDIRKAIQSGANSLQDISLQTQASTNCGTCASAVDAILQDELKKLRKIV
jgi:bacterioferritin-associated ferredoxin